MHLNFSCRMDYCPMCLRMNLCFRMDKYLRKRKMKRKRIRDSNGNKNMNRSRKTKGMQLAMTTTGMKVEPMRMVNLKVRMVVMMPMKKVHTNNILQTDLPACILETCLHIRYIHIDNIVDTYISC